MSLDGNEIKANANKHKALSWEYANRLEAQLQADIEEMRMAEEAGTRSLPDEMDIPEGLKRREERPARRRELPRPGPGSEWRPRHPYLFSNGTDIG